MRRAFLTLVLLAGCGGHGDGGAVAAAAGSAAHPVTGSAPEAFEMARVMVPMRDGARLETVLFTPAGARGPLPILLTRTPYGIPSDTRSVQAEWYAPLRADGYIFAFQNLRGRFGSQGTFVMDRPPRDRADPRSIDESTDAHDSIAWLVENVPNNNGRVGMLGGSYAAWTAVLALLEPHPALKVISEAASPGDQFLGDDVHHNGAFRLDYTFEYSAFLELEPGGSSRFSFGRADAYDWFLELGPVRNVNERYFHGKLPSWNEVIEHPDYDAHWRGKGMAALLSRAPVAVMNVAGAWDQEDYFGPLQIYQLLERHDERRDNHLLIGPWNHDGWSGTGRRLLNIDFGSDTGPYYRERQARWLARWLHDEPDQTPEAHVFVSGQNRWQDFERWPPVERTTATRLYLREGRRLAFEPPPADAAGAFDEFISDPDSPVPYRPRPIAPAFEDYAAWATWQLVDQRFADRRPDVFSWQSEVLEQDLVVAGDIVAELFASTSGTDSDWVVKLIDVYPDGEPPAAADGGTHPPSGGGVDLRGYQLMVANEVLRGRYRESFSEPRALAAGETLKYEFSLREHAHAFLKGHRIMVQVQSSLFPVYDRNPQRFVPSIYAAQASDFVKATQRVSRAPGAASAIVLPVLTR